MVTATALPARVRLMMNPIHLMTFSCTCMPVHELKNWYPVDFSPPKDEPSAGDAATEAAAGHLAAKKTIYIYIYMF